MEIWDRVAQIGLNSLNLTPENFFFYSIYGRLGYVIEILSNIVVVNFGGIIQRLPHRVIVKYDSPEFKKISKHITSLHKFPLGTPVITRNGTCGCVDALHPEVRIVLVDFGNGKSWIFTEELREKIEKEELREKIEKCDPNQAFLTYKQSTKIG
jgi:hypothetical protein